MVALLCIPTFIFSQSSVFVDSLLAALDAAKKDTHQVILLNDLAWELKFDAPEQARQYLDTALSLALELNYQKGAGNAFNYRGVVEDIHGNSEAAIEFFNQSLAIRETLGDQKGVASLLNNIGNVKENLGDYVAALENYQKSLLLREALRDTIRMTRLYYNISILHDEMGNYPEALDFIYRYLEATDRTGNRTEQANAYNVIGNIKTELGRFEEARTNYEKALSLHRSLGNDWEEATVLTNFANLEDAFAETKLGIDTSQQLLSFFKKAITLHQQALHIRTQQEDLGGQAEIFNNIGYVLKNIGSFHKKNNPKLAEERWQEAFQLFGKALAIHETSNNQAGIMEVLNGIGDVHRRRGDYERALNFTFRYKSIAEEIDDQKFIQNALKDLARIYFQIGEHRKAYEYRREYDELRYQRFSEERTRLNERREVLYSDTKKQSEIERQRQKLLLQEAKLNQAVLLRNSLIGGAIGLVLLLALLFYGYQLKAKSNEELAQKNKIIETERQRSEDLLLNILPAETAHELKAHGKAQAKRYESVTVLFTDFQSFTQIAERTQPEVLVAELHECFKAFDEITTRHGIEKIKTIGDAYMCAGGLPTPNETHPTDVLKAALEIRSFMQGFRQRQQDLGRLEFKMRMGIHTGPVVAGVVGNKKFAYDIWGDTVNLAARLEETGEISKINISKATYELVKNDFTCIPRGKLEVKNKDAIEMYFVE